MIIHHLATTATGGAGAAAEKLAAHLGDDRHKHRLFCADASGSSSAWTPLFDRAPAVSGPRAHLHRLLLSLGKKNRPRAAEPLSLAELGSVPAADHPLWRCDVLNLQWLGGSWLDFERLSRALPAHLPVVWTLHDLNPVSAICHYPGAECAELESGCGSCPWVGGVAGNTVLRASFAAKSAFYRQVAPYLVTICAWQDEKVRRSPLGQAAHAVRLIPNLFDLAAADSGLDRGEARRLLDLPPEGRYILTGAAQLTNRRKGMDMLAELTPRLPTGWSWLTFGARAEAALPGVSARHFGLVKDRARLAAIYAAADLFLLPSREECLAQTGLEALANGTSVLTAADTGPADYVEPGRSGLLARTASVSEFAAAIATFDRHPELQNQAGVRATFAELHHQRYSARVVREAYNRLYDEAVNAPRKR